MNVYTPFKKYDYILNNKALLLAEKILVLLEVWNKISKYNFSSADLKNIVHLVDWAILHNMNIILTAEWQLYIGIFKKEMIFAIDKANEQLTRVNTAFRNRFEKLINLVVNTWTNTTLEKLMKVSGTDLTNEDTDFFNYEEAYLISVRLMKLCDSNCEDLALNLATAFLKYVNANNVSIRISVDQIWFIFDVKITLLYKFKEIKKIEDILGEMKYEDGIYFINRFVNKKPKLMKIWKYSPKIATMAIHLFLEKIVREYQTNLKEVFKDLLEMYLTLSTITDSLDHLSSKIKQLCDISNLSTLHCFCEYFKNVKNPKLKYCIIEIFIKTLTVYMNELELMKNKQNAEKNKLVTSTLADIFCGLAEFMNQEIKLARECVLTAFSLDPTTERLKFLELLADKSGLQISNTTVEWKCKLHPPILPTDDVTWMCPECYEYMCKPQLDIPLKANLALNEAIQTLDLPETLCEDLIVCISNPRYRVLSWYLPWNVLYRLCLMYLKDQQATKNFTTELKFVNIDYSMFDGIEKDTLDEYGGIEKGYEKYLDKNFISNEDDEENENAKSDYCAIEGDDYDPNSIESLKKILSIQNSQEGVLKRTRSQEGEFSGKRIRNPRSILKSSFNKDDFKDLQQNDGNIADIRSIKRKLQSYMKDKNRKILKPKNHNKIKQK